MSFSEMTQPRKERKCPVEEVAVMVKGWVRKVSVFVRAVATLFLIKPANPALR